MYQTPFLEGEKAGFLGIRFFGTLVYKYVKTESSTRYLSRPPRLSDADSSWLLVEERAGGDGGENRRAPA